MKQPTDPAHAGAPAVDLDAIKARQHERDKITHLHGNLCLTSVEGQQASDDCSALVAEVERLRVSSRSRCQHCGGYLPGHASGIADMCECEPMRLASRSPEPERMFPIQRGPAIPWSVIARCEHQAQRNHSQSIERLAERGGLDAAEAIAVLNGKDYWEQWPNGKSPDNEALARMLLAVVKERLELQAPLASRSLETETAISRALDLARKALFTPPNGALVCRWCHENWTVDGHDPSCHYVQICKDISDAADAIRVAQVALALPEKEPK